MRVPKALKYEDLEARYVRQHMTASTYGIKKLFMPLRDMKRYKRRDLIADKKKCDYKPDFNTYHFYLFKDPLTGQEVNSE